MNHTRGRMVVLDVAPLIDHMTLLLNDHGCNWSNQYEMEWWLADRFAIVGSLPILNGGLGNYEREDELRRISSTMDKWFFHIYRSTMNGLCWRSAIVASLELGPLRRLFFRPLERQPWITDQFMNSLYRT